MCYFPVSPRLSGAWLTNVCSACTVLVLALTFTARPSVATEPLAGPVPADIVWVFNGHTIQVRAHTWLDHLIVTRVRLRGLDSPEPGAKAKCAEERTQGKDAVAALRQFTSEGQVTLQNIAHDVHAGQVVADVFVDDESLVDRMLEDEHGREFDEDGGEREGWCDD